MKTATLYRLMTTGACLLREGGRNYGIATTDELAAIQRLVKAAGGDSNLHNTNVEDWAVLLKTGANGTSITDEQLERVLRKVLGMTPTV